MQSRLRLHSANAAETRAIAARLGALLAGGEIIALYGDLGAGKTTFVQGLLQGMGSRDRVTSPTFTLVNVYQAAHGIEVHHVDAYRLGVPERTRAGVDSSAEPDAYPDVNLDADLDADLDAESLALDELLGARKVVVVIEWAGRVAKLSRDATLSITLTDAETDAGSGAATDSGAESIVDRRTIAMRSTDPHGVALLQLLREPVASSTSW